MAQRTTVSLVCDLPHDTETEGFETVRFGVDGQAYEIDACLDHVGEVRNYFGKLLDNARKVTTAPRSPERVRDVRSRADADGCRQWAKSVGKTISERGRIPVLIFDEWKRLGKPAPEAPKPVQATGGDGAKTPTKAPRAATGKAAGNGTPAKGGRGGREPATATA